MHLDYHANDADNAHKASKQEYAGQGYPSAQGLVKLPDERQRQDEDRKVYHGIWDRIAKEEGVVIDTMSACDRAVPPIVYWLAVEDSDKALDTVSCIY